MSEDVSATIPFFHLGDVPNRVEDSASDGGRLILTQHIFEAAYVVSLAACKDAGQQVTGIVAQKYNAAHGPQA